MSEFGLRKSADVACSVIVFPPERQRSEIVALARRLLRKKSTNSADQECSRVADAMFDRLARLGLSELEQDEAVGAFFHEVELELENLRAAQATHCACCAAEG